MNTGRLISLLAGFLAVAFSTTAASAQKTWTGFYVGVQGGRAWAEPNYHNDVSGFDVSWHTKGDFAGGIAGYNYQLGNVVLGLQGEYNYADIAGSEVNIFTNIHTAHLRNFGSIDGRLGLAFLGNTMIYGIGGVAFGDIKQKFSGPTGTPSTTYSGADRVGWDLGAGIELLLGAAGPAGSNIVTTSSARTGVQPDGVVLVDAHSQKMTIDTARIGIAYKLGSNKRRPIRHAETAS